jgi:hypothetical protein
MQSIQCKNPFVWRLDWFKEDANVRVDVNERAVDAMDCMIVVSGSDGAGKALMTKHLGAPRIMATAEKVGFALSEIKYTCWKGSKSPRRTVPISVMVKLLGHAKTPEANKLAVDLKTLIDDICEGKIKPPAVTDEHPTFPVVQYEGLTRQTATLFEINPFNTTVSHTQDKVARAKAAAELHKEQISYFERSDEFTRKRELAAVEHAAKKQQIEASAEHELYKLKLKQISELKTLATNLGAEEHKAELEKLSDEFWEKVKNNIVEKTKGAVPDECAQLCMQE